MSSQSSVPSISYSITVRLEVAARGNAVSQLTHAVEQAGGIVTALDGGRRGVEGPALEPLHPEEDGQQAERHEQGEEHHGIHLPPLLLP